MKRWRPIRSVVRLLAEQHGGKSPGSREWITEKVHTEELKALRPGKKVILVRGCDVMELLETHYRVKPKTASQQAHVARVLDLQRRRRERTPVRELPSGPYSDDGPVAS